MANLTNLSPLFVLSSLPRGLKILKLLLTNNANLVQSINANILSLALSSKSGQMANHSPLYMLCCSAEGRDILYNLLTKNTRLAKSISPEALCLDVPSLRSPAYFLSTTKDGMKIMKFLICNNPGLGDALKIRSQSKSKRHPPHNQDFLPKETSWQNKYSKKLPYCMMTSKQEGAAIALMTPNQHRGGVISFKSPAFSHALFIDGFP